MNITQSRANLKVEITVTFSEEEATALNSIASFSPKDFLELVYTKLGKSGIKEYEEWVILLMNKLHQELPKHLERAERTRSVWNGDASTIDPKTLDALMKGDKS